MAKFESEISAGAPVEASTLQQSWTSRAIDSFLESGKAALSHPVDTAVGIGTAAGIGAGIQATLNAAERVGGRIGAAAEVAKIGLLVLPTVYTGVKIGTASDSAKEAGKAVFDTGLFLGASGLGAGAVRANFLRTESEMALASIKPNTSLASDASHAIGNPLPRQLQESITLAPFQLPHLIDQNNRSEKR